MVRLVYTIVAGLAIAAAATASANEAIPAAGGEAPAAAVKPAVAVPLSRAEMVRAAQKEAFESRRARRAESEELRLRHQTAAAADAERRRKASEELRLGVQKLRVEGADAKTIADFVRSQHEAIAKADGRPFRRHRRDSIEGRGGKQEGAEEGSAESGDVKGSGGERRDERRRRRAEERSDRLSKGLPPSVLDRLESGSGMADSLRRGGVRPQSAAGGAVEEERAHIDASAHAPAAAERGRRMEQIREQLEARRREGPKRFGHPRRRAGAEGEQSEEASPLNNNIANAAAAGEGNERKRGGGGSAADRARGEEGGIVPRHIREAIAKGYVKSDRTGLTEEGQAALDKSRAEMRRRMPDGMGHGRRQRHAEREKEKSENKEGGADGQQ